MPGRDGKGPQGAGPGTGGRRGPCFSGVGYPRGTGQGADWANVLHNKAAMLERELEEVRRCIKDYEAKQA